MKLKCRTFFSPDMSRYVLFTESVLSHMYSHAQRKLFQTEAGGEIYSRTPYYSSLVVDDASGPHPRDRRSRRSFNPDIEATTQARHDKYEQGRHAVGLWHTHPERQPTPSGMDRRTTEDYFRAFNSDRERYLTVIIGNRGTVPAMTVWSTEKCGKWIRWVERDDQLVELQ
ncbi:Mov34/MPN/PAD-1 family protein [Paracidovorax avenae]|uniref:Mov34/MPN/PAD-1 family protein n=1 Tax=Paracidovorax avenae TaxID=80867 RepID=UPI0019108C7C|nr:Mov34/MPN/PAD-1 family protein [Paracidovorax avenae]